MFKNLHCSMCIYCSQFKFPFRKFKQEIVVYDEPLSAAIFNSKTLIANGHFRAHSLRAVFAILLRLRLRCISSSLCTAYFHTKIHTAMSILALNLILTSATAFASSGGHHGESPKIDTLLWPAINFSLFLFLVIHFYKKLAKPVLRDYRIELEANVAKHQNEHNILVSQKEQLRERISNLLEEKAEIITDLEKDGRDLSNMIVSSANQQAEKISNSSKIRYNAEVKKVSNEARKLLFEKVVTKVVNQISSSFSTEDDKRYINSSIDSDLSKIFQK